MSRTLATTALIALLVMAAGVEAQQAPAKRAGSGTAWPRTFTGQPDFEFTKAEILAERARQAEPQGIPAPKAPTLAELMEAGEVVLIELPTVTPSGTLDISGTMAANPADTLADFNAAFASLPSLTTVHEVDVTEFQKGLRHAVRKAVAAYKFQAGKYSLGHMVNAVTVQAVVTSPEKYAVLDGKQYHEGESFPMTVWAGPSDTELLDAMAAQLPMEGSMDPEQAAQYQEAYENAVQDLANQRQANPRTFQKQVIVPVVVAAIKQRLVVLEFNGQRHELPIRYAY
ncbi:MAG: hypothetical protein WAZ18_03965 [Alphaproteobacteria bacterium]